MPQSGWRDDVKRLTADEVINLLRRATESANDAQLARWLGIPQTTVSGWRKRHVIPYEACARVAAETGTSMDVLVFGDHLPPTRNPGLIHRDAFRLALWRTQPGDRVHPLVHVLEHTITFYNDLVSAAYERGAEINLEDHVKFELGIYERKSKPG